MPQCLELRAPSHQILPATVDTIFDHPDGQAPYTRNPRPSYSVFHKIPHLHFPFPPAGCDERLRPAGARGDDASAPGALPIN